jgi:hypothetical protein
VGKAPDFVSKGVDGLLNVMPLGCLLSYIPTFAAYDKLCQENQIPRRDLRMDGLHPTVGKTRLGAFMELLWERENN